MITNSEANVLLVLEESGTEKTAIAREMKASLGRRMKLVKAPPAHGDLFSVKVDWRKIDLLAIDAITRFDHATALAGLQRLESEAIAHGKMLILQTRDDLRQIRFQPASEPLIMEIKGRNPTAVITRWGRTVANS